MHDIWDTSYGFILDAKNQQVNNEEAAHSQVDFTVLPCSLSFSDWCRTSENPEIMVEIIGPVPC